MSYTTILIQLQSINIDVADIGSQPCTWPTVLEASSLMVLLTIFLYYYSQLGDQNCLQTIWIRLNTVKQPIKNGIHSGI